MLYAKNENEVFLASVTKLMTALLPVKIFQYGSNLTDDLATEGDSGLRPGERWRIENLLSVMLLVSSNDAAHAVAGFVGSKGGTEVNSVSSHNSFVKLMNERALALGLDQMEFFNESGLDVSATQNGGYGSARNVAKLFEELWEKYPGTVEVSAKKDAHIFSEDNLAHILPNTNEIVGQIPGLVASKTGFTNISGGNLVVIFDKGMGDPVVVVVLGSSYKGRFDDMQKLVAASRVEVLRIIVLRIHLAFVHNFIYRYYAN